MPTAFQPYEGWSPRSGDPLDRMPAGPSRTFETSPQPPQALRQGLDRPDGVFAVVPWAARDVLVALYAAPGSSLRLPMLCVDADGDGTFEGVGERRRVMGRKADRGETWSAELTVQGVPAILTLERTPTERRALSLGGDAPRVLALKPLPPQDPSAPEGLRVVLLNALSTAAGPMALAWARGPEGQAAVGVDRDGDGLFADPGEWQRAEPVERRGTTERWRAQGVVVGSATVDLLFEERLARTTGTLAAPGALRGTATLAGRQFALFLLDQDLDGSYTSPSDLWWFGPPERLAGLHELTPDTLIEGDEPVFLGASPWRLAIVEADGTAHLRADPEAGSLPAYLARRAARAEQRWEARLAGEAEAFRLANAIDPARPRAAVPTAWSHAPDLSDALARARAEQRPVLAVFEADWCPWCHRLARHTFADAEVARLLERFVCVRVNYDFATGGETARYGGRSLPFLLLLDGSGRLLEAPGKDPRDGCRAAVVTAFETPAVFAGRLAAALTTFEALTSGAARR